VVPTHHKDVVWTASQGDRRKTHATWSISRESKWGCRGGQLAQPCWEIQVCCLCSKPNWRSVCQKPRGSPAQSILLSTDLMGQGCVRHGKFRNYTKRKG
jgi:hypothetical protein